MSKFGVKVDLFTRYHDDNDPDIINITENARVIHLKIGKNELSQEKIYDLLPDFVQEIKNFTENNNLTYDLLSTHYWLSGLVGNILKKDWDINHVSMFHTLSLLKQKEFPTMLHSIERKKSEFKIVKESDRILVWSEHEKKSLLEYYDAKSSAIKIVSPGINSDLFHPEIREQKKIKKDVLKIIYVGRLEPLKGLVTIIKSLSELNDLDISANIFGGDVVIGETQRLINLSSDLGVTDKINFHGPVIRELLPDLYRKHDLLVMPSFYESFGLSILEAQSSGLPVIASNVGGISTIVKDNVTGYLISPPNNYLLFSKKIRLLANDVSLRMKFGINARNHAKLFDWNLVGKDLVYAHKFMSRKHLL
tara:strand:- start:3431 stop:4522 length:1092 start_codon:yes stop_codon:yes gene_type:complete